MPVGIKPPKTFQGKKGRSGRKSLREEADYFKLLDASLPRGIRFLVKTIETAELSDQSDVDYKWKQELAIKAVNILNSKAPQRVQGPGDEGEFLLKIVSAENYKL